MRRNIIRKIAVADGPVICTIYNHYIATTTATFEESPVTVEDMARRIDATSTTWPWLVAEQDGVVIGYAYASQWKSRSAYRHTAESTIYIAPARSSQGTGVALYRSLLENLQQCGMHCAIAGIALPNAPSIGLHEKLGFTKVAHFRESGFKFGRWIDVGYWQRML